MPTFTPFYNLAKPLVNSPVDEDLWGGELNDNMDIIDSALHTIATSNSGAVPSGALMDFAGSTAPTGWLLCFGQAVSRSTYSDLFSAIGTTWGAGDGSTTFNLPDFRGRVGVGKDDMGGTPAGRVTTAGSSIDGTTLSAVGGAQNHTLTVAQLAAHNHAVTVDMANANMTLGSQDGAFGGANNDPTAMRLRVPGVTANYQIVRATVGSPLVTTFTASGTHTHTASSANTGTDAAHNNMQPTAIVLKIIKV